MDYKRRNVIERGFNHLKQWRGIATRFDKLAIVYRAATVLHAAITRTKPLSDTAYLTDAGFSHLAFKQPVTIAYLEHVARWVADELIMSVDGRIDPTEAH